MKQSRPVRVGLISDTHNLLRPDAVAALQGVQHIIHAGDVCGPHVLEELAKISPLTAVRGNNDSGTWAESLKEIEEVEIAGCRVCVVHDLSQLRGRLPPGVHVVVSGHSHRAKIEEREGTLYVNPGSAGPRRFRLPVTLAELRLTQGEAPQVKFVELVAGTEAGKGAAPARRAAAPKRR